MAVLEPMCASNAVGVADGTFEKSAIGGIYAPEILSLPLSSGAMLKSENLESEDSNMPGNNAHPGGYMKATLDRIEGSIAVLLIRDDERLRIDLPVILLPEGSKEGDILDITIHRDDDGTQQAKKRTSDLIEKLKRKSSSAR